MKLSKALGFRWSSSAGINDRQLNPVMPPTRNSASHFHRCLSTMGHQCSSHGWLDIRVLWPAILVVTNSRSNSYGKGSMLKQLKQIVISILRISFARSSTLVVLQDSFVTHKAIGYSFRNVPRQLQVPGAHPSFGLRQHQPNIYCLACISLYLRRLYFYLSARITLLIVGILCKKRISSSAYYSAISVIASDWHIWYVNNYLR